MTGAVSDHVEDKDLEDYLLERNKRFRSMLRRVRAEKGGMSMEEYRRTRAI